MLLILFAITSFAIGFAMLVSMVKLADYRTDITRGQSFGDGASPIWQKNVMNPANYSEAGRQRLRRFKWLQLAFAASLVGLLLQLWHR